MTRFPKSAALGLAMLLFCSADAFASSSLDASWSDGIRLNAGDGSAKLKIGGRLQNDWVFQSADDDLKDVVELKDGTEFRRIRLYASGTLYKTTEFKAQLDFAGGSAKLKDMYIGFTRIPAVGTIRIGQQYEPQGFNEMTSSKYITFIERALPMAFVASRTTGILATNQAGPLMWTAMVSHNSNDFGKAQASGEYNAIGRLVLVPWNPEEDKVLHLGVSGSQRGLPGDELDVAAKPENHLAPDFVSATVAGESAHVLGAEAALVMGRGSVQGEYLATLVDASDDTDPMLSGWYVAGSWFLTGESRPYKAAEGTFNRVKPKHLYDGDGGAGAWELGARYSTIDLDDENVAGGTLADLTVALNWYPNPNIRWMLDYVRADLDGAGVSNAVLTRVQVDW